MPTPNTPPVDADIEAWQHPSPHARQPTDYFLTGGYKKMALVLLKRTVGELAGSDATLRQDAHDWITYQPRMGEVKPIGLDFELTVELADLSVSIARFRRACLEDPAGTARQLREIYERRVAAERPSPEADPFARAKAAMSRWITGRPVRAEPVVKKLAGVEGVRAARESVAT